MKTIGLLGGMSWESTVTYYQIINTVIKAQLGGLHSAKCLLYSFDFQEIEKCQAAGDCEKCNELLADAAAKLETAGADFIIICSNTMHTSVGQIKSRISIPVLHIAEATAEVLLDNGIRNIALLGTKYTVQKDFYKSKLIENSIGVMIPNEQDVDLVNAIIYDELCLGIISEKSKRELLRIIEAMSADGAEAVILGCTEIGLLISQQDTAIPLFDTTRIHATKAALFAIGK